ncbi:MAG: hypothetical protein ACM3X4_04510 [Ignavibacteriales bacterium]
MAPDMSRFLGMEAGAAREAAGACGFAVVSEKVTSAPGGRAGSTRARVLRVRVAGPDHIEFVIAREQSTLDELQEPPR